MLAEPDEEMTDEQAASDICLRPLRPHAGPARRVGPTRGHRAQLHRLAAARYFLAHAAIQRVRNLGNVAVELRHAGGCREAEKGIKTPADLKGKRGGVPEYTMTAAVYMRGLLEHEYGVKPSDVEWVQGRADRLGHKLPSNIRLRQAPPGGELGDLLERGEIDFMMTANNPLAFRRGSPKVRRLFPNYPEVEKDYYRRTKIYPIMHTVVIRNDVYQSDPWLALSMYKALCRV